jgi:hypothetical protein
MWEYCEAPCHGDRAMPSEVRTAGILNNALRAEFARCEAEQFMADLLTYPEKNLQSRSTYRQAATRVFESARIYQRTLPGIGR